MQYTMINTYRTDGTLDLTTWVLVRERDENVGAWTFAAYPFSAVGDAVACMEDGALADMTECTQTFYSDLRTGRHVFVDDMRNSGTEEGPFPHLNWRTA